MKKPLLILFSCALLLPSACGFSAPGKTPPRPCPFWLALMRLLEQAGGLVQCDKMLLQRRSREVIELSEQSACLLYTS